MNWTSPIYRAVFLICALCAPAAQAQIVVGQTAGFSGPVADAVKEEHRRRQALHRFRQRPRRRQRPDDRASSRWTTSSIPSSPRSNAQALAEKGAVALFLSRGTPNTQAILPVLAEYKLPLVAPSTGAMLFHQPVNPYVFNVRTSYQRETERVSSCWPRSACKRSRSCGPTIRSRPMRSSARRRASPIQPAAGARREVRSLQARFQRHRARRSRPRVPQAVLFICSGSTLGQGVKAFRAPARARSSHAVQQRVARHHPADGHQCARHDRRRRSFPTKARRWRRR